MHHTFKAGQELYYVPWYNNNQHYVKIKRIGRLYLVVEQYKVSIATLQVYRGNGDSPVGTCYLSEEAYNEHIRLSKEWDDFRQKIQGKNRYGDITLGQVRQAKEILGLQ